MKRTKRVQTTVLLILALTSLAAANGWEWELSAVAWFFPENTYELIGTMQWVEGSESTYAEIELYTWHYDLGTTSTTEIVMWMESGFLIVEFGEIEPLSDWRTVARATLLPSWRHDLFWVKVEQVPGPGRHVIVYDCDRDTVVIDATTMLRDTDVEGVTYYMNFTLEYWRQLADGVVEIIPQYGNGLPWYNFGANLDIDSPPGPHHERELFDTSLSSCHGPTASSAILVQQQSIGATRPIHVRSVPSPEEMRRATTSTVSAPNDDYDFFVFLPLVMKQVITGVRYSYNPNP